jgi:virulence-associated protein VapD
MIGENQAGETDINKKEKPFGYKKVQGAVELNSRLGDNAD